MAIAVASKSAIVSSNYPTASVTLTAPTGITTGDLLLIVAASQGWHSPKGAPNMNYSANSGLATCTGFSEAIYSSWDPNNNSSVGGCARISVLYKIAVLADQSATEYVVTHNPSSYGGAAIMFRITGWSTGNPLAYITNTSIAYEPRSGVSQDGSDTIQWGNGAPYNITSRPSQQVLFFAVSTNGDEDGGFNYSNYATVPSVTFTEDGDTTFNVTNYDGGALGVAHATSSATTDIMSASVYKTYDASDGNEATSLMLFAVFDPVSASGTVARINTTATFYDNDGLSDVTGTVARINKTATFPSASGKGTTDTVWAARSKNSTTWTPRS